MAYQAQYNGYTAFKVQSGLGSAASGSGATVIRTTGGGRARLSKAVQESQEVRTDGMRSRGRHGTYAVSGSWDCELSLGSFERIMEATLRGTFASDLVITEASGGLTSITTGTNTIVNGGGSWITQGVRVGDVARLTGHSSAGNNSRNLRITGVTASTITVAETLTSNGTPDTAFTLTIPKKLSMPTTPTERYFTLETVYTDLDSSEIMQDCKFSGFRLSMAPNGLINCTFGATGTGQFTTATGGSSPSLTSPTTTTSLPMAVVDATLRVNGTDVVSLTSFDISVDNGATTLPVFGSGAQKYSPDVFTGQVAVGLNFTALRSDLSHLTAFTDETVYSLHVLMVENESEPKDFISLWVPNFTLGGVDASAFNRAGGPLTETISVPPALVGKDTTGGAYDATMINIQSTGA